MHGTHPFRFSSLSKQLLDVGVLAVLTLFALDGQVASAQAPPTLNETTKLRASDTAMFDQFGSAVSVSGSRMMVGAPNHNGISGAMYVFERSNATGMWNEDATLGCGQHTGISVSVSGDTALAGATAGRPCVFERDDLTGNWNQAPQPEEFIRSRYVAVSGRRVVGKDGGAAYASEQDPRSGTWLEREQLDNPTGGEGIGEVSISGGEVLVGFINGGDTLAPGVARIHGREGGTGFWVLLAELRASDEEVDDQFGFSVSLSGNTAVIGAPADDDGGEDSGSVYVFERNSGTGAWSEVAKLAADDAQAFANFGDSVFVLGNRLLVGAPNAGASQTGAVYDYNRDSQSGNWNLVAKLLPSDGEAGDRFGDSVAISGGIAVVGSPQDDGDIPAQCGDPSSCSDFGAVYVFEEPGDLAVVEQPLDPNTSTMPVTLTFDVITSTGNTTLTTSMAGPPPPSGFQPGNPSTYYEISTTHDVSHSIEVCIAYDAATFVYESQLKLFHFEDGAWVDRTTSLDVFFDTICGSVTSLSTVAVFERITTTSFPGQMPQFLAPDGSTEDTFGVSVSMSGDRIVVGSPGDDDNGFTSGSAHVFEWDGTGAWNAVGKLLASDGATDDQFGYSVSVSGDRIVVGALGDDDTDEDAGSAFVFERDESGIWTEVAKLLASDAARRDQFGYSVSASGDRAVVGAPRAREAYVFERDGTGVWNEVANLLGGGEFGSSVSMSGNLLVVGSPQSDRAHVFERDGAGLWTGVVNVEAPNGGNDNFGISVSLAGDWLVVGADEDDDLGSNSGSAHVFEGDGTGTWNHVALLLASDGEAFDHFGGSVSASGDRLVVGAYGDTDSSTGIPFTGSAYVFERDESGTWTEVAKLLAPTGGTDDFFGSSVSASANRVMVGAYQDDDQGSRSGSAYVFDFSPPPFVEEPVDTTTGTMPVTLTFEEVTNVGITTLTTSMVGPPPPLGFQLGDPATYYDISTTHEFTGAIEVCISYAAVSFSDESQLKLFHYEDDAWVDRTISLDIDGDVICGSVTSLSPFAIFEQLTTIMFSGDADTYIKKGPPNQNQSDEDILRIRPNNNTLVRFDHTAVAAALGGRDLAAAKLRLYVEHNANNWGPNGRNVGVHRMTQPWTETGATWNCPNDTNTSNSRIDCSPSWDMDSFTDWPFMQTPTSLALHTNGVAGWVEWDVTADVAQFLEGSAVNVGWLIRSTDSGSGHVDYYSREGAYPPQLVVMTGDPPPAPSPSLTAAADSYVRNGAPNQNQGYETILRIQASGNNRILVHIDQSAISSFVGSGALQSAKLRLYITENANNWGTTGRTLSVHRVLAPWTEIGATWNCPDDTNPINSAPDCSPDWEMTQSSQWPFELAPTATMLHTNGQAGWVEWDVTADVAAFLSGEAPNHGWILKKDLEGQPGQVSYSSKEGDFTPELEITLVEP